VPPSDDQYVILKPLDTLVSMDLTYRILNLLSLRPMILFDGAPDDPAEYEMFFEENFASFVSCLTTSDERIRHLTSTVARKLMVDGSSILLSRSLHLGNNSFYGSFWRST
jgi:neurofibromin 1